MPAKKKVVKKGTVALTKPAPVKAKAQTGRFTWANVVETVVKPFSRQDWSRKQLDANKVK